MRVTVQKTYINFMVKENIYKYGAVHGIVAQKGWRSLGVVALYRCKFALGNL